MKTLVTIFLLPLGVKVMPVLLPFQRLLLSSIKWLWTFVDNHMMEEFFHCSMGFLHGELALPMAHTRFRAASGSTRKQKQLLFSEF